VNARDSAARIWDAALTAAAIAGLVAFLAGPRLAGRAGPRAFSDTTSNCS
jgi:hypothetical protein